MFTSSESEICRKTVEKFGVEMQQILAIEKLCELIQAISKITGWEYAGQSLEELSDYIDNLSEGIADVEIMLEQLKHCYGCHIVATDYKRRNLEKLSKLIK